MATEGAKSRPPTERQRGSGVNDTQVLVASARISSARGLCVCELTVARGAVSRARAPARNSAAQAFPERVASQQYADTRSGSGAEAAT